MISAFFVSVTFLLLSLVSLSPTLAFPQYESLAGLSAREWNELIPRLNQVDPPSPPGPLKYNGTKLVHDRAHSFKAPQKGDIRGPCPGLNTLANHGVRLSRVSSLAVQGTRRVNTDVVTEDSVIRSIRVFASSNSFPPNVLT